MCAWVWLCVDAQTGVFVRLSLGTSMHVFLSTVSRFLAVGESKVSTRLSFLCLFERVLKPHLCQQIAHAVSFWELCISLERLYVHTY